MYTIDTMIERLQELREIAQEGGNTPVVVHEGDSDSELEPAAIELQPAMPSGTSAATGSVVTWFISASANTCQVAKVF